MNPGAKLCRLLDDANGVSDMKKKDPNVYPKGWSAARVRRIANFYDNQSDEDAAKEIENAVWLPPPTTWVQVPNVLLPQIKRLLEKHRKSA